MLIYKRCLYIHKNLIITYPYSILKMAWNIKWQQPHKEKYGYLKNTFRVNGKMDDDYIYLGPEDTAIKILADLALKPLIDEESITYSGEMVLEEIADSLTFENILVDYAGDKRASNALKNIIILMALFKASKRKLFMKVLNKSVLKESTDLKYLEEVYGFMDLVYEHLGDIVYDMVKAAHHKYDLDLRYLIVDATRFKVYKDEETGLIKFGWSAQKRKDLPQVNLVLGVNNQQIPFFVSTHPGNTSDIEMFDSFLKTMRSKYRVLNKIPVKIIVMDQGNVNKDTIRYLRWLVRYSFHFVAMVRSGSISRFIKILNERGVRKDDLELIHTKEVSKNKETKIYGKLIEDEVYGRVSRVLVCYNPDVEKEKNKTLDGKIRTIEQRVELLNKKGGSLDSKLADINSLIETCNLKRAITVVKEGNKLELEIDNEDLDTRREKFGFFALFTHHKDLTAKDIITIYKSKDLVEKGFEALNIDFNVCPINHSKDKRIETHIIFKICGYFFVSLLRAILKDKKIDYSFGELLYTIKSGTAIIGYYEHEIFKNKRLYVKRPTKMSADLTRIFRLLKIKIPKYDVKREPYTYTLK